MMSVSGVELPEGGQGAAAEPGPIPCEWQLWLRAQASSHERWYSLDCLIFVQCLV